MDNGLGQLAVPSVESAKIMASRRNTASVVSELQKKREPRILLRYGFRVAKLPGGLRVGTQRVLRPAKGHNYRPDDFCVKEIDHQGSRFWLVFMSG